MSKAEERFTLWQRNVVDKYKDVSTEDIKKDLQRTAFPYAVMMSQVIGDFNFSSIVRTANAFNAEKVFYYGKKHWDRRASLGTHNYTDVQYLETIDNILKLKEEYSFVGLEQTKYSCKINDFVWPKKKPLLILGEEGYGLTEDILEICDYVVEIELFGSVRSLNVGTAGAIAIYDFLSKK